MRRRSFLEAISAAATGLMTGQHIPPLASFERSAHSNEHAHAPTGAGDRQPPTQIRKAVKFHMLESDAPVGERFRMLREAGFEGVEFRSPNEYETEHIVHAQEDTDLEVIGVVAGWKHFGSNDPKVLDQSHNELNTALRDAADYGASLVLLVPETVSADMPYRQAYEQSIRQIGKALPRAAELDVQIGIENVWNHFLLSPLEFAAYVDAFDSEWLGAYFDVGNVAKLGWPEQWIRILGPRILRLDIKGFSRDIMNERGPGAGFEADIGEGTIDWAAVERALDEIGFQGWATAEEAGGGVDRMRQVATQMDRVLPTN